MVSASSAPPEPLPPPKPLPDGMGTRLAFDEAFLFAIPSPQPFPSTPQKYSPVYLVKIETAGHVRICTDPVRNRLNRGQPDVSY
jgi:hypothetical protein